MPLANSAELIRFFVDHGRDLPWREPDTTPWGVLVSEVMLQQTPVVRVEPVYQRWMERWPTPADLASAPVAEVIRMWGRLGYPRRALRLHEAASVLQSNNDGQVPSELADLLSLPGVGAYTARAVAAFAFGQRVPVVDTNVRRVLSRAVRGIDDHAPATAADRTEVAAYLPDDPAEATIFSAALMELGAVICTARKPDCGSCPLADTCRWRAAGYPANETPRRAAQRWHGTDRQVRGRILAVLRGVDAPLTAAELRERSEPSPAAGTELPQDAGAELPQDAGTVLAEVADQWSRCLKSLLDDGLAAQDPATTRIALP